MTNPRSAAAALIVAALLRVLAGRRLPRTSGDVAERDALAHVLVRNYRAPYLTEAYAQVHARLRDDHAVMTSRTFTPGDMVRNGHALAVLDGERPLGFSAERADRENAESLRKAADGVAFYRQVVA